MPKEEYIKKSDILEWFDKDVSDYWKVGFEYQLEHKKIPTYTFPIMDKEGFPVKMGQEKFLADIDRAIEILRQYRSECECKKELPKQY